MIVITGATGYIGGKLTRELKRLGIPYLILSRSTSNIDIYNAEGIVSLDADSSIESLTTKFKEHRITGIIHLASKFLVEHSADEVEDLVLSNILMGAKIAEAAALAQVRWFLNVGTFWQHYVDLNYEPVNLYSATKQAFQDIGKYYASAKKFIFCNLKIADTYGPDDHRRKIFNIWRDMVLSDQALEMSPGNQLIDVVHIDDVITTLINLAYKLNGLHQPFAYLQEYFITSGRSVTLKELAQEYELAKSVKLNIHWGAKPYRSREVLKPVSSGIPIVAPRINIFID